MRLNFLQVGRSAEVALATRPQANAALAAAVEKPLGQTDVQLAGKLNSAPASRLFQTTAMR
ncbi:hypothetical protein ACFQT4_21940 [Pseudoduganella danionis]|uniref:hypothetical protein n=1 Tax=Pseudoduganella danionis TaxID=1890295 RepID=UPI00360F73F2